MTRKTVLVALMLLATIGMFCKKQDVDADKAAVLGLVQKDTTFFNANTKSDTSHPGGYINMGDTSLFWWRDWEQTNDSPDVQVSVAGDSGYVQWSRHNWSWINFLQRPHPDSAFETWRKRIAETMTIKGIFFRTGKDTDTDRGWKLRKISLITGQSDSTTGVRIDSLRIKSELNPNTVITKPLATYFQVDSLLRFRPLEPCSLFLYTNTPDGEAYLHSFLLWFYVRGKFTNMGGGVYAGFVNLQLLPIPRFAIFDVMDARTLHDRNYGYDYNGWLLPYIIKNQD